MTTNQAAFTINTTASEDPVSGDRKYVGSNAEVLTLTLEVNPSSVLQTTYSVYSSSVPESPLASLDAPIIVFTGSGTYSESPASPNGSVTITLPATGSHSYNIRCVVSTSEGSEEFVRQVSIPKVVGGENIYKTVPSETSEFYQRGFSDKINTMVEAANSSSRQVVVEVDAATYALTDVLLQALHVTYTGTGACLITIASALIALEGWTISVKDTGLNAGANNITIATEGAETIDGAGTLVISANAGVSTLQAFGGNLFTM